MAAPKMHFFLNIEIKNDSNGVDVEKYIETANRIISSQAVFKFRVVGEPTILAIFELEDATIINGVSSAIIKSGPYIVTCLPLTPYEQWAKILEVNEKYLGPSPRKLTKKCIYWADATIEYHGILLEELMKLWNAEATFVLEQRSQGKMEIELFKILGQRRVMMFSCSDDPTSLEKRTKHLPMPAKMGDQIYLKTKIVVML